MIVGLAVKPVGEPDAGNPHVRFDERGRETEQLPQAQATAPFLDSTADRPRGAILHSAPRRRVLPVEEDSTSIVNRLIEELTSGLLG